MADSPNPDRDKSPTQWMDTTEMMADILEKSLGYVPRQPIPSIFDGEYQPRPLPAQVPHLCGMLDAPDRLVAHLAVVHDAACEIVEGLRGRFPDLEFDREAVLFGAAIHDLGKVLHPDELAGPGNRHEENGPPLLERHGVPPYLARFARTHGAFSREELALDDLLVALADAVWKGQRLEALEKQVIDKIATQTGVESWEVFSELDSLLEKVASQGDERLAWQRTNR